MAGLIDQKKKIDSTKNTGQITKALELVSASKQKKSLDFLNNSRSLRIGIKELMTNIIEDFHMILDITPHKSLPPLFHRKKTGKVLIVTIMSHRGLCGSINTNLFYSILKFKKVFKDKEVEFISINKIAQKYLKNFGENVTAFYSDIKENPDLEDILPVAEYIKEIFEEYETVYLANTDFVKTGIFEPKITQLLPLSNEDFSEDHLAKGHIHYTIEPDPVTVLTDLSHLYINFEIYEAILSSQTAEHSARMIAMKKATDNVKELVKDLTLTYNKERQAKITQAMAEISSNI